MNLGAQPGESIIPPDPTVEEYMDHIGSDTFVSTKKRRPKGIKLDFKDFSAVKPAIQLLLAMNVWAQCVTVWMNGDICSGPGMLPGMHAYILPAKKFISRCCKIPDVVLSLGWSSTEWGYGGVYTDDMVRSMLEATQVPYLQASDGFKYTPAAVAGRLFCGQCNIAVEKFCLWKKLYWKTAPTTHHHLSHFPWSSTILVLRK